MPMSTLLCFFKIFLLRESPVTAFRGYKRLVVYAVYLSHFNEDCAKKQQRIFTMSHGMCIYWFSLALHYLFFSLLLKAFRNE